MITMHASLRGPAPGTCPSEAEVTLALELLERTRVRRGHDAHCAERLHWGPAPGSDQHWLSIYRDYAEALPTEQST